MAAPLPSSGAAGSPEARRRRSAALRRSGRRALGACGVVILGSVVAPSAASRPAAAAGPPATSCPAHAAAGADQVAGYNLGAQAEGARYALASPGLLPVGDAEKGTIMEFDVPFARDTVSEGPVIDALGSPAYPGDTAAHLGTAVATFGGPPLPNDPVLAEAAYPPSPGVGPRAAFGPAGGGSSAGSASATAGAQGAAAQATAASSSYSPTGGAPGASSDSATSTTKIDIGTNCVDASATAATGAVDLAGGLIHIGGITGTAAARSDGSRAAPEAHLSVGQVTVGGLAAYIDHDGIHLAGQQPLGFGVVGQVQAALNNALQSYGMAVKLIDPTTTKGPGAAATADSGGVEVTFDRTLPATGVPGVPAISVPGQPPVPVGSPPLPLHMEVIYGSATASADATNAPPVGAVPTPPPPATPTAASSGAPSTAGLSGGTTGSLGSSGTSLGTLSGPGAGPSVELANSSGPAGSGVPVPVGWIILGILASLVVAGPLFGYARWQLLEGRM